MSKKELRLSPNESVRKRYDFVQSESGVEDALIFTDNRVIRRVSSENAFSQQDVLLRDVNRIVTSYKTTRFGSKPKVDPKRILFFALAGLFSVMTIVTFIAYKKWIGFLCLLLSIVFLVIGARCESKVTVVEKTLLRIDIYERISDKSVISVKMECEDKAAAISLANEVGTYLQPPIGAQEIFDKSTDGGIVKPLQGFDEPDDDFGKPAGSFHELEDDGERGEPLELTDDPEDR